MNLTALIIQLISGAIGGQAANAAKDTGLGTLGNTIAGAIGGGVGGQILSSVLGLGLGSAAAGLDIGTIVQRCQRRHHGARDRPDQVEDGRVSAGLLRVRRKRGSPRGSGIMACFFSGRT